MGNLLDLLAGRPRARLAPSLLLGGEVTTPYGREPSHEDVETAWRDRAGDRPLPPWILLGPRDTPNGTVWKLAWCPPAGEIPSKTEIVLPRAAWTFELLSRAEGPSGWHSRFLRAPEGSWTGIWEGGRCEKLLGPFPADADARERLAGHARRMELAELPEIVRDWEEPGPDSLRAIAEAGPESDLLDPSESLRRAESRADRTAAARTGMVAAVLAAVSLGLGAWQAVEHRSRLREETRLASVAPLLERVSELRRSREILLDSLRDHRDAMAPNSSADRIVSGIARSVPEKTELRILQIEAAADGWKARTEARLGSWDQVRPFAERLRASVGIRQVSVSSQNRSDDGVAAVLELQGDWP